MEPELGWNSARWIRRRKGIVRRIAEDVRIGLPALGVALCVLAAATAIEAIERIPAETIVARSQQGLALLGLDDAAPRPIDRFDRRAQASNVLPPVAAPAARAGASRALFDDFD